MKNSLACFWQILVGDLAGFSENSGQPCGARRGNREQTLASATRGHMRSRALILENS